MNDLDERFGDLRAEVERRCTPDLADVVDRRRRRRRTKAVAFGATVFLVVGGALITLPQLGSDSTPTAAEQNEALSAEPAEPPLGGPESAPGGPVPESADELIRLDTVPTSLLDASDLDAIGEPGAQEMSRSGGAALLAGCGTAGVYSDPARSLSVQYSVGPDIARLYAAEYPGASNAAQALDRLVASQVDCPAPLDTLRISVGPSAPGEYAMFTVDPNGPAESSGSLPTAIAVQRVANVLVEFSVAVPWQPETDPLPLASDRARMGAAAMAAQLRDPEAD